MKKEQKSERELLEEINDKLERLLLISALSGLDADGKKRFLKNYKGNLSKRELEKLTGLNRHDF